MQRAHQYQSLPSDAGWTPHRGRPTQKFLATRSKVLQSNKVVNSIAASIRSQLTPISMGNFPPPMLEYSPPNVVPPLNIHPQLCGVPPPFAMTSAAPQQLFHCPPQFIPADPRVIAYGICCDPCITQPNIPIFPQTSSEIMTMSLPDQNAFGFPPTPAAIDQLCCQDDRVRVVVVPDHYNECFPLGVSETLQAMKSSVPASSLTSLRLSRENLVPRRRRQRSREDRGLKTQSTISHDQISDNDSDIDIDEIIIPMDTPVVRRKSRGRLLDDEFRTQSLCLPDNDRRRRHLIDDNDKRSSFQSLDVPDVPFEKRKTVPKHRRSRDRLSNQTLTKNTDKSAGEKYHDKVCDKSSDSIGTIIDDVRAVLLGDKPINQQPYISDDDDDAAADDEVATTLQGSAPLSASAANLVKMAKRDSIEGGTVHARKPNVFPKCRSYSNSITDVESEDDGGNLSDDVFAVASNKRSIRYTKRRSSSLDAVNSADASAFIHKLQPKLDSNRQSTVSINNKLEYYEYIKSPEPPSASSDSPVNKLDMKSPSSIAANSMLLLSSAENASSIPGVAALQHKPTRGSLKKKSSSSLLVNHTTTRTDDSEYDVRDRGRGRNGATVGRDAYGRNRGGSSGGAGDGRGGGGSVGGGSDRETDRHSDREPLEDRGSFNNSLSGAEGALDDKIGKFFLLQLGYAFNKNGLNSYENYLNQVGFS